MLHQLISRLLFQVEHCQLQVLNSLNNFCCNCLTFGIIPRILHLFAWLNSRIYSGDPQGRQRISVPLHLQPRPHGPLRHSNDIAVHPLREFSGLWASSTCSNDPNGEYLCAAHMSGGKCDWELIGYRFIGGDDRIVLDTTHQMLVLSVLHIPVDVVSACL